MVGVVRSHRLAVLAVLGRAQHGAARDALAACRGEQVRRPRRPLRTPLPPLRLALRIRNVLHLGARAPLLVPVLLLAQLLLPQLLLLPQELGGDVVVREQAGEQLGRAVILDLVDLVGVGVGIGVGVEIYG